MSRFVRSRLLHGAAAAAAIAAAIVLAPAGAAPRQADTCFGGPAIGPACGTLTEANLHQLVADLTLAQKVGLVHGQSETTDPQFGCGNTGQPNAFPVINPGATDAALVAGCVGQAGINNGVKGLGIPPLRQTDGPAGVRLSHQETGPRRSPRCRPRRTTARSASCDRSHRDRPANSLEASCDTPVRRRALCVARPSLLLHVTLAWTPVVDSGA